MQLEVHEEGDPPIQGGPTNCQGLIIADLMFPDMWASWLLQGGGLPHTIRIPSCHATNGVKNFSGRGRFLRWSQRKRPNWLASQPGFLDVLRPGVEEISWALERTDDTWQVS